jgi:AmiR/NasT family two-component response regulator
MTTKKRVLIVEDDALVSEMIQGMLTDVGYSVAGRAINGLQAIEMTQSTQPDVILLDLEMPVMNGFEAAQRILEDYPTPIVVLTAYGTTALLQKASIMGVGAYLVKPPNAWEIERAITIAIARFEDLMALRQLNVELKARNQELQAALTKVKTLSGLLPICASCKKIRNDQGYWQQVELYFREHSELEFSHGLCPDCVRILYPDFFSNK